MKEIKVRVYGRWTSYVKHNKELPAIAFSGTGRESRGRGMGVI
jgi:hypothetical protein